MVLRLFHDSMDCSLSGSSDHKIFQARILEWVAISSSRGPSQPRDQTHVSRISCIGRWILYYSAPREAAYKSLQKILISIKQKVTYKSADVFTTSEKAMVTHCNTLAWKIPWAAEPGRLQSVGSLRVGHDWATSLLLFTFMHWRRKWQPTPIFLPGQSQRRGSLVGCRLGGHTESDTSEATLQQQQLLQPRRQLVPSCCSQSQASSDCL